MSALWEALMPRGVANRPGKKSGRPRAPAPLVTRALELVEAGTHSVEDAAEEVGLGMKTVYRAREAGEAPEVAEPASVSPGGLALAPEIVEDIFAPPDPEQTAAIRLLVVRGTLPGVDKDGKEAELPVEFGADWIARVAEGEGITPAEVRRLLRAAAVEANLDALPFELARERSIAVAERFLTMALEAHDGRAGLAAQTHIDRLRFSTSEPDPEGMTRAGVTALFQRVAAELRGVPGGVEALRRAIGGG